MKLLFDHNISHELVPRLEDLFPGSSQTRRVGDPERSLELFE